MVIVGAIVAIAAGIIGFVVANSIRAHAARLGLMQAPNTRSSHTLPTPSGGGVGIVAGGSLAGAVLVIPTEPILLIPIAAGVILAGIGFYDDRRPLPARLRLAAQIVLAGLTVGTIASMFALQNAPLLLPAAVIAALAILAMVYWVNIFNFMDGIDGIAGTEATFMFAAAALLAILRAPEAIGSPHWWWLVSLAGATLGFLALNLPPAKIFMGDAGSTYLGFMLAVLAMVTIGDGWLTLAQWAILGAAFIADATVTLLRRLWRRERIFEAHRRHAYQALSRRWGGHRPVTLAFLAVNVVWLLPLAWLAADGRFVWPALALAYFPLAVLALMAGAGATEREAAAGG